MMKLFRKEYGFSEWRCERCEKWVQSFRQSPGWIKLIWAARTIARQVKRRGSQGQTGWDATASGTQPGCDWGGRSAHSIICFHFLFWLVWCHKKKRDTGAVLVLMQISALHCLSEIVQGHNITSETRINDLSLSFPEENSVASLLTHWLIVFLTCISPRACCDLIIQENRERSDSWKHTVCREEDKSEP